MITKINIEKFGIFNSFKWNGHMNVGGERSFNTLNIIFGRNYSGKTTLSRIFRCVEKKELHKNHQNGDFVFDCHDGTLISHSTLDKSADNIKIRVYNTDFVNENLNWIHNEDGLIEPFTILGAKNIEIDNEIKEISKHLGTEKTDGLLFEMQKLDISLASKKKKLNNYEFFLESKLKAKANDKIKVDRNLFLISSGKKTYNIRDIEAEIESIKHDFTSKALTAQQKIEREKLLTEEPKPPIVKYPQVMPNFSKYVSQVQELVSKEIEPNQQISELINDSLLQDWVRHGIDKHKGKLKNCAFCGGILPEDLWSKLNAHFNKESEDLRKYIDELIISIEGAREKIGNFIRINKEDYYSNFQQEIIQLSSQWTDISKAYSESLAALISELSIRKENIFKSHKTGEPKDLSEDILNFIISLNQVIDKNNAKASTLEKDQHITRYELRISNVAQFALDIDFNKRINEINKSKAELKILRDDIAGKRVIIDNLLERRRLLESEAKDETKGAQMVNQHISDYFGHDELILVAEGESPNIKFKIMREGSEAKNLSEGECSLISFCYFIAKIEDELNSQDSTKQLIIYIDDPISSLDSNHIFFMFSLIENIIAKPKKYKQLFISTHNLDFLKYLKRLTTPNGKESLSHYLIERRQKMNDRRSFIVPMPDHLKDYVTEFNYLFNEIYKIYQDFNGDKKGMITNTYNQFYNLPNNMRKFLECYLFYKYPNSENPLDNLSKLFDGNTPIIINRFINEYSHLTYIDRGWKPIDIDEAEACAKIVIEKIQQQDPNQFAALLESIR